MSRIPTELEFRECNTQVGETNNDRMEEEERSSHHLKSSDSSVGNNDMMKRNIVERQHSFKSSLGCDSSSGHVQDMTRTLIFSFYMIILNSNSNSRDYYSHNDWYYSILLLLLTCRPSLYVCVVTQVP